MGFVSAGASRGLTQADDFARAHNSLTTDRLRSATCCYAIRWWYFPSSTGEAFAAGNDWKEAVGIPSRQGISRFPRSRLGVPPRRLSPALRRWALKRFLPRIPWGLLCIIAVATMSGGASFILTYFGSEDAEWLFWIGVVWIILDAGGLVGAMIFMRSVYRRRGRQLLALVERGTVCNARVLANQVDYFASANGVPKIVVALEVDGRPMEIRAFDSDDADLFPPDSVLHVLYAESIPGIVFPTSQIPVI
jgi:hypothetical protein